jgi:hypothetical protein
VIVASPLRPGRIERESRIRLETTVSSDEDLDFADITPMFGFAAWDARPSQWTAGQWRPSPSRRRAVAESPLIGVSPLALAPGAHFAFLKVGFDLEAPVIAVGRVIVN